MYYDAYGISSVREKIKNLPYVKDYHIQQVEADRSRSSLIRVINKIKIRIWIYENKYLAEILSGEPTIENILRDMQKIQPISYDIFYV
jgi:hypothetical protein